MRRTRGARRGLAIWFPWTVIWLVLALALAQLAAAEPAADASAGYVDDATCGTCHADLATSYQEVGMARAFGDSVSVDQIEVYSTPEAPEAGRFFHQASDRWYEMRRSDSQARPVFRRWHEDDEGRPVDLFEVEVDWTLGSGHTSRSYLVQQPGGELFVLPVAWYSQSRTWAMAPGFDKADHLGVLRRVQRECMFCHNAYPPNVEAQPDRYGDPHLFPTDLPHGTGCQRCHGPGAAHVEAAYVGGIDGAVRSEIVHPGRLSPKLCDDVCEQCHLQPSVALTPTRRFGRRVYSYRPGDDLDDYIVYYDPEELATERSDRFEINHHPYRMRQSTCFLESGVDADGVEAAAERLSCLTCHDPHRKVPKPQRAEHYRQACQSCHEVDACGLEEMTAAGQGDKLPRHMRGVDPGNCVGCHMPRRRTRDVIHVVMTDHKIQKLPGADDPEAQDLEADLTAPREEFTPTLMDMDFYLPAEAPDGVLGEVYKAFGVELIGGNEASFRHLGLSLAALESGAEDLEVAVPGEDAVEPRLQLARGHLRRLQTEPAMAVLQQVLRDDPDNVRALTWMGLAHASTDLDAALGYLESARERAQFDDPDLLYNLGVITARAGRPDDALAALETCVELRPLHANAWMQLGLIQEDSGDLTAAEASLRRSLSIEPRAHRPRLDLARVLLAAGQRDEAVRELRHGLRWSETPEVMAQALRELGVAVDAPAEGIKSTDGPTGAGNDGTE